MEPVDLSVQIKIDSIYGVRFPENNKRRGFSHKIFAVSYNGNKYIKLKNGDFLQLYKMDNTFYFRMPESLPNMYATISENLVRTPDVQDNQLVHSTAPLLAITGGIIGTIQQHKVNVQVRETKERILDQGFGNSDLRNCFLDMDTGDIVYY